jgi:ABC-type uncharacterized transport system substrate-binding protein
MIGKMLIWLLAIFLLSTVHPAQAQQPAKVPRIGLLIPGSASDPQIAPRVESFRQGLQDLGYIEGNNIIIEYRYADGRSERLPELAEELVRLKIDIFVVANDTTARAAKKSTASIPIVMAGSGNPIGSGVIASLARPGGNVTGLTSYSAELLGKRLQLLKEVVPKVTRFGFLNAADSATTASGVAFKEAQGPAKALGVQLKLVEVKAQNPDIEGAFRIMAKERIGALITSPVPAIGFHRKRILELVGKYRIPAMHPLQEWANDGGLMSYGANTIDQYRRAATYVDKILKGSKPGELPVEQPAKFEFVINLKTAKQIGVTIPQSVLYRADKVIK